ncbi:hypothetical protein ONE63_006765 [Megalurothrips usitatus]|uniref:Aquaporin AQPcic-like n=1 Tax=Megalurothrips usitatus TaxID=439358 RepID=A0AAV7XU00_9NEOP|nr:hypothetical protein ONE63_006765 [Megalurothrips usitatus]
MDAATKKLLAAVLAEALGIGMVCFFGCAGTLSGPLGQTVTHFQVAITFGLIVMIAIACFAHVSGAHFNPAVTLMALIMKVIDIKTAVAYVVAQIVGGALGYGMLKVGPVCPQLVTPSELLYWNAAPNATGPCCTVPHQEMTSPQALLAELIATCALLMLCCAVWDPRNATNTDGIPVKFGLLIAGIALCIGPYTGASLNPARTLGPAIWENTWTDHWVYWVAPLSAAIIVGYGWPLIFSPIPEPRVRDHADVPLTLVSTETKRHPKHADDDNDVKAGY